MQVNPEGLICITLLRLPAPAVVGRFLAELLLLFPTTDGTTLAALVWTGRSRREEAHGAGLRNDRSIRPTPAAAAACAGRDEPPGEVEIDGQRYRLLRVVKHDSWAATAFYTGPDKQVVCKFNRQQRVGLIPMGWLGRWLARREAHACCGSLQGCRASRPLSVT